MPLLQGGVIPALVDAATGAVLTHDDLRVLVHATASDWPSARGLVALEAHNDVATIVALLSLRAAGHVVLLLDPALAEAPREQLLATYAPDYRVSSRDTLPGAQRVRGPCPLWMATAAPMIAGLPRSSRPLHPDLALCLATSGSTGSPKLVRLTDTAVVANARSIAEALAIAPDDRAVTCLPLHYAYGLSLVTSHLAAGASILVSSHGFLDGSFWQQVRMHGVTSLAGVPFMYEMLERLGVARAVPPGVRVMTQAGGRLAEAAVLRLHAFMAARGGRFHVMYGQTEATARMAVMPHDWLPARVGGVGCAVPGGTFRIVDDAGAVVPPGTVGEVVYTGANVMLGYATTRADLALGDVQRSELRTGDLGYLDAAGGLVLTGRLKRIGKLHGVRIDLDAVERQLAAHAPVAVVAGEDQLVVFTTDAPLLTATAVPALAAQLRVQQRAIRVRTIDALPRTSSGKVDYPALERCA